MMAVASVFVALLLGEVQPPTHTTTTTTTTHVHARTHTHARTRAQTHAHFSPPPHPSPQSLLSPPPLHRCCDPPPTPPPPSLLRSTPHHRPDHPHPSPSPPPSISSPPQATTTTRPACPTPRFPDSHTGPFHRLLTPLAAHPVCEPRLRAPRASQSSPPPSLFGAFPPPKSIPCRPCAVHHVPEDAAPPPPTQRTHPPMLPTQPPPNPRPCGSGPSMDTTNPSPIHRIRPAGPVPEDPPPLLQSAAA